MNSIIYLNLYPQLIESVCSYVYILQEYERAFVSFSNLLYKGYVVLVSLFLKK